MHADALPRREAADAFAGALDDAGDLVAERERQCVEGRNARAVMRVAVADAGGADTDEHVVGSGCGHGDFVQFERPVRGDVAEGFHDGDAEGTRRRPAGERRATSRQRRPPSAASARPGAGIRATR